MEAQSKILVVDDEDDICSTLQERLTMEGYRVWTAQDGRKALEFYQDHQVDLIITDVLMPEIDGLEVVRALRRGRSTVPIIAISGGGADDLDFLVEAEEFGATRTMSKPFSLEELVAVVHDLLDFNSEPTM